jgi:2-succinyl-5-enolpyruvyl-6-hydroxy-3-cyclohexene-1-carboxylate synthase
VSWQLPAHISSVERALREDLAPTIDSAWRDTLRNAAKAASESWAAAFDADPALTEPAVTRTLAEHLDARSGWMLSNSMPIRNVDLFAARSEAPPTVITNRGASGIDGILSTAIGWAHAKERPVTVLLGDQALLHDLNALTLLHKTPHPVTVVVINNGGGGLFSFLPIAEDAKLVESTFAAAHEWRFLPIAESFGVEATAPTDLPAFRAAITESATRSGPHLIEIRTERLASRDLHHTLRARAVEAVEDALKR